MLSKKGISLIQIEKHIAQGIAVECSITHNTLHLLNPMAQSLISRHSGLD